MFIERAPRLIRPVNYPKGTPGRGAALVDTKNGKRALVINAMGRIFMDPLDDPFAAVERELAACALKSGADAIVLDMHCEATSEKQAMGYFVDGRVSLVVGTHTHCPTADHRIMPGRTAFVSDVGMTGDFDSVIGMNKDEPLNRFLRKVPGSKFEPAIRPRHFMRPGGGNRRYHRPGAARRRGAARRGAGAGAAGFLGLADRVYFRCDPAYIAAGINLIARRADMAGHSQFKNIMHRKGKQDKVRSKLFGKLAREITVSAKLGLPDPAFNPRLRAAVIAARAENMPKDNIERAIKKAQGSDAENYDEIRYEGYGPGGVAVIVEALTDNHNRTAGEVRATFTKNGGNLATTGAVSFMFDHVGVVEYDAKVGERRRHAGSRDRGRRRGRGLERRRPSDHHHAGDLERGG